MQRIPALDLAQSSPEVRTTLDAVKAKLGLVPNLVKTMAIAPAVLNGYLGLSGAIGTGRLSPRLREQIALAVAKANGCDYCASAHQAIGAKVGLTAEEIALSLDGDSTDTRARAALAFAISVLVKRGKVSDTEIAALKAAGFGDDEVLEIVGNVALNILTNYLNNVADTEIDFPRVATRRAG